MTTAQETGLMSPTAILSIGGEQTNQPGLSLFASKTTPSDTGSKKSSADDDLNLIRSLQNGDDSALNGIMERYKNPLFSFIYRYVDNETDAEDLLEQTFSKLYLNRHRYEPKATFKTWLYTIAVNLCRDWARSRKRKPAMSVPEIFENQIADGAARDRLLPKDESPERDVQQAEEASLLRHAIDTLPSDLKSAVVLFSLEGHTQEECGEMLGCSTKAVETRVYRAKKLLMKRLEGVIER